MPKQRFTTEEIIHKLREADVLSGQSKTVAEVCKQLGVTDKTYFRWRKTHGGDRPALTGPALMSVTQRSESRLFSSLSSNAPPSSQVQVAYSPVRYAA